jgi:hypothetical protein
MDITSLITAALIAVIASLFLGVYAGIGTAAVALIGMGLLGGPRG